MKPDFQHILTAIPACIIVTDLNGKIVFINDTASNRLGLDDRTGSGNHIANISNRLDKLLTDFLANSESLYSRDLLIEGKLFEVDIAPVRERKKLINAIFFLREQNVFKASHNMPSDQQYLQLQFDATFNYANIGMWIVDGDGVVLKVNPAAEKLIGVKAAEVVGEKIVSLADKGVIDQALTPHVLKSKKPTTKLLHVLKTNKFVMSSGIPVFDNKGDIIFVVVNELDITTLKALQGQLEELRVVTEKYKDALSDLNLQDLKEHGIISESKEMKQVLQVALKLAHLDVSNILILGESGTGKGLIAQFIHDSGKRRNKPFIQINCAALPESLLEAELFGFEKGAFTGAGAKGKIGLLEMAQNGTILLDEIGELPWSVQSKLLKCLDEHEIMHIGGLKPIKINCTIIAATNRDLRACVSEHKFREDLFHRLNAFHLQMPPLRDRPEDIVALANFYLDEYNRKYHMHKRFSLRAINEMQQYAFPGNVRELKNIIKQGVVISEKELLDDVLSQLTENRIESGRWLSSLNGGKESGLTDLLNNFERSVLEHARRRCKTTRKMAAYLNTSQSRIARMLKKHQMSTKTGNA